MSQTGSTGNTQKRPKHQKELHHCWVSERNERKTQLVLFGSLFDKCISNNGMHFCNDSDSVEPRRISKATATKKRAVANHHGYKAIDDFIQYHPMNKYQPPHKKKGFVQKTCASSLMQTLPLNMFKTGTGAGGKAAGTVVWVVPAEKGYCSLSPQCRCIVAVVSKRPSHVLPASKLSELLSQWNLHYKCQRKKNRNFKFWIYSHL